MKKSAAPRGRPRAFDADKALDRALQVFWRKGYEGTSLSDLTRAMGINRPSLYAAFGDKEALFRKVLDRYVEGPSAYVREALEEPTARAVVERLLLGTAELLTDMAPSPPAAATRLAGPARTSPAANTPAWLVSSRNGGRRAVQWGDSARSGPVRMNPLSSRSISGGSQSVRGTAPMKLNTAGVSTVRFSPVLLLTISMDLRWPSPFMRCTVELRSSSMLGVCSIRLAR